MPTGKIGRVVIGQRFGKLTAIRKMGRRVLCRCDCGSLKSFLFGNLNRGASRSCGCLRTSLLVKRSTKHGRKKRNGGRDIVYGTWCRIRRRCENLNSIDWPLYGGRGIRVCKRWQVFVNFAKDVGEPPSESHTLDRWPDNNGDYKPGNVRWATAIEQANNTRKNVVLVFNSRKQTIAQWAREAGLNYLTLYYRLSKGWPLERALSAKLQPGVKYNG